MSDEIEIGYSVKELLKGLSDRIDGFMALLGSKADAASVAHAMERIDGLDNRVKDLEHISKSGKALDRARQEFRRWAVPVLLSTATTLVLVFQVIHP